MFKHYKGINSIAFKVSVAIILTLLSCLWMVSCSLTSLKEADTEIITLPNGAIITKEEQEIIISMTSEVEAMISESLDKEKVAEFLNGRGAVALDNDDLNKIKNIIIDALKSKFGVNYKKFIVSRTDSVIIEMGSTNTVLSNTGKSEIKSYSTITTNPLQKSRDINLINTDWYGRKYYWDIQRTHYWTPWCIWNNISEALVNELDPYSNTYFSWQCCYIYAYLKDEMTDNSDRHGNCEWTNTVPGGAAVDGIGKYGFYLFNTGAYLPAKSDFEVAYNLDYPGYVVQYHHWYWFNW